MSVEYYYMNDLNTLYNASVGDKTDGGEHHMKMMVAHDNLEAYMQKMEHWRDTALQLSRNNGEAQAKINALEADYVISNRELLVKQVEIQGLTARIAELEAEIDQLTAHDATERQDDKLPEREVCEACGGDGSILLRDNYKGQATATVDCPYCNCTGYVKECEE